jgi:DNA-binding CsgD family transcriptional regulator
MNESGANGAADTLGLVQAWLDQDDHPRIICTTELQLIWANAAALECIKSEQNQESDHDTLALGDPGRLDDLRRLVRNCDRSLSTFAIKRRKGEGFWLVRAREIGASARGRFIGLVLVLSDAAFKPAYADIEEVFHLTPTEHRLLMHMVDGATLQDAAERMNFSIETGRTHIRHIYAKMDVSSREGMFARLRPHRVI